MDAPKSRAWVWAFAFTYGLAYALNRSSLKDRDTFAGGAEGWPYYWLVMLALALFGAAIVYTLGSSWYKFRVRLSGMPGADIRTARRVYLSAAQIVAIPSILHSLIMTLRHETPLDAALAGPTWMDTAMLFFPFWSFFASYRGVRTVFKTPKADTAVWFLILPGAFAAISLFFLFALASSGFLSGPDPAPDLDHPREFSSSTMAFSYPGNWTVLKSSPDYDPESNVRIKPFQDMVLDIGIVTYEPDEDPGSEPLADFVLGEQAKTFGEPGDIASFSEWGALKGVGLSFMGQLKNIPVQVRVFVAPLAENTYFLASEIVREDDMSKLGPGLDFVRTSFRPVY